MLGPIVLKGPCIETLKALTDKTSTINVNHWNTFQYIDRLVLGGGGKLDGLEVPLPGMTIFAVKIQIAKLFPL